MFVGEVVDVYHFKMLKGLADKTIPQIKGLGDNGVCGRSRTGHRVNSFRCCALDFVLGYELFCL